MARTPTAEQLEEAKKMLANPAGIHPHKLLYANEIVEVAKMPVDLEVPVQSLCVNDLGIVGLHGEVFVEIGLDTKERSPFPQTMVVGLANGTVGYIATDKALDEGSYETRLCRHVRSPKGTGKLWADTAVADLAELKKRENS